MAVIVIVDIDVDIDIAVSVAVRDDAGIVDIVGASVADAIAVVGVVIGKGRAWEHFKGGTWKRIIRHWNFGVVEEVLRERWVLVGNKSLVVGEVRVVRIVRSSRKRRGYRWVVTVYIVVYIGIGIGIGIIIGGGYGGGVALIGGDSLLEFLLEMV